MVNKVLICAPIGGSKQYSINTWFRWISKQTYPHYDLALCANGENSKQLCSDLLKVEIKDQAGRIKKPIVLHLENSEHLTFIQRITYSREMLRLYAIQENYDYIFWLDTDTIPFHKDVISKLMLHDKESISGLYFYKNSKVSVVIDKDTFTNISIDKMKQLVNDKKICMIMGSGYGCLLHTGEALKTPFDYKLFGENRTDDFGHCHVLEMKGIPRWFDPSIICKHLCDPEQKQKFNTLEFHRYMYAKK